MGLRNFWGLATVMLCALPLAAAGLGFFAAAVTVFNADVALAQDEDEGLADDVLLEDEKADAKKPAAKEAKRAEEEKSPAEEEAAAGESLLGWMFKSLGISYSVVFLGLSFTLVALFVMNLLAARRDNMLPAAFIAKFEEHLDAKQYQEAYELAKADESFLAQVLSAGLAKLSRGFEQAVEAMQEAGEEENMKMEHRLSYMALIGTISPMVGLLGTVQGMIASFQVIATSTTAPKPSELAAGISTALFTTLVGLFIAIPAIAAYNIIRNRMARLVLEIGIVSEDLMERFSGAGKKKKE